jgi:hypothetical protein
MSTQAIRDGETAALYAAAAVPRHIRAASPLLCRGAGLSKDNAQTRGRAVLPIAPVARAKVRHNVRNLAATSAAILACMLSVVTSGQTATRETTDVSKPRSAAHVYLLRGLLEVLFAGNRNTRREVAASRHPRHS